MGFCRRFVPVAVLASLTSPALCTEDGGGLVGWVESTRGAPVAGAVISVFGKGISGGSLMTLADSEGQFILPSLPAGSYTLRALGTGHLPSAAERRKIFDIHIRSRNRDPSRFDLDKLTEESDGYSGSEIEQTVISALYDAFDKDDELNDMYLFQAIRETVPLSRTMQEDIASMRDWAKSRARLASYDNQLEEREVVRKIDI